MKNNALSGHINLIATLFVSLVLPLILILLSYLDIISGIGNFITAFAVIATIVFLIGGGIWMFIQDKKDVEIVVN